MCSLLHSSLAHSASPCILNICSWLCDRHVELHMYPLKRDLFFPSPSKPTLGTFSLILADDDFILP